MSGISSKLDSPNNELTYHFDWGDDTSDTTTSTSKKHTYNGEPGSSYTITVYATDKAGNNSPSSTTTVTLADATIDTPTVSVTGSPDEVPETPTISISHLPAVHGTNKSITGLKWRVVRTSDNSTVYTKTTGANVLSVTLPEDTLEGKTKYRFGVQAYITT